MKNYFFLILTALLISCSNSDNDSSNVNLFNPPNWIRGNWIDDASFGFRFTSNNVCQLISTNQNCFKEMMENYISIDVISASVDEEIISDNEYKFSYTVSGVTQYFHFVKLTNTSIEYVQSTGVNPVYYKQ